MKFRFCRRILDISGQELLNDGKKYVVFQAIYHTLKCFSSCQVLTYFSFRSSGYVLTDAKTISTVYNDNSSCSL